MKTPLDIVDILFMHLNGSSLNSSITGIVCKKRPIDSKLEDVVINSLGVSNQQLQVAVVNVNIYVPNMQLKIGGKQDNSQPNTARLQELANIAKDLLTDQWAGDYNFDIQQIVGPIESEEDQHYINIRLEFFSINILN
jgi:hypothetical protein